MKEPTTERSSHGPSDAAGWTEVDVAVYETFVVPRYTARFGELLVEMVTPSVDARIAHLGCRTGYPDPQVLARLPDAHLYGWDRSVPAVELARVKQQALGVPMEYATTEDGSNPFPEGAFSHVFSIHPTVPRKPLLHEFYRLLAPAGQAAYAMFSGVIEASVNAGVISQARSRFAVSMPESVFISMSRKTRSSSPRCFAYQSSSPSPDENWKNCASQPLISSARSSASSSSRRRR